MATSNVLDFYIQLDATKVEVGGQTPPVYTLDELKQATDTADLPLRLLLPTNRRASSPTFQWLVYGHTDARVQWVITDLMLWKPINQTAGLKDVAEDLVTYVKRYVEMIVDLNLSPNNPVQLTNLETAIDVFRWPESSERYFWGAECILTIEEMVC